MSAFSFTSPVVTPEDEQAERDALGQEEVERIRNELLGSETQREETDEMLATGLRLLLESLAAIPDVGKRAYLEALEIAPQLVEQESDPLKFLRCENYDPLAAAQRLVAYWEARKKIFGADRAFLPMTQRGAMAQDVVYLRNPLIMVLPEDNHGRLVLYWDRIRCVNEVAPRDSIARCFFYTLHTLCESVDTQKRGFVVIVNLRGYDLYRHFDRIQTKKCFMALNNAPSRARGYHLCTGSGRSVAELVLPVLKQMGGLHFRLHCKLHAGSELEVLDRIGDFGLVQVHIRTSFGLTAENDAMQLEWLQERQVTEDGNDTSSHASSDGHENRSHHVDSSDDEPPSL